MEKCGKMLSMESFSGWLLRELKVRDMSQSDLARIAGLGSGTISNIVSGNRKVGQETLVKIAHALRLPDETVFRAAGLLPQVSEEDAKFKDWKYLLERLSERDFSILRDLAEKMVSENEKERD
ncbi:MAG: hypothetical protein CVU44_06055 [Chloroflexi bacterium HGW-Chloroflexi-6]|nr:MAG: hypothetical protein CVU44_06055 [Chloroflexi bacterium HGW-Chloroflexi-6]